MGYARRQASGGGPKEVVMVGVGSLGSQLRMDLAREGAFEWTIVDGDALFPHNMAPCAVANSATSHERPAMMN